MNSAKLRAVASSPTQQYLHSLTDPQLEERLVQQLVRDFFGLSDHIIIHSSVKNDKKKTNMLYFKFE